MKKFIRFIANYRSLTILIMFTVFSLIAAGCQKSGGKSELIDIETVTDFTGRLIVTLPSGERKDLTVGERLIELPHHTLIEVKSGELVGVLLGKTIVVKTGQIARIVLPVVGIERIIQFTGKLKIILPSGEEIIVEAGEPLPELSPGTRIEVLSGELTVLSEGKRLRLSRGEIGRLESDTDRESPVSSAGDISPASPFTP